MRRRRVRQRKKGPIGPKVGRRIQTLRLTRQMTQGQLAGDDFSKGFISLVECGRTRISLRAAGILAQRLGVPLSLMLAETGNSEHGIEAALESAIERARELERYASRTQTELRAALAAVRQVLDVTPDHGR